MADLLHENMHFNKIGRYFLYTLESEKHLPVKGYVSPRKEGETGPKTWFLRYLLRSFQGSDSFSFRLSPVGGKGLEVISAPLQVPFFKDSAHEHFKTKLQCLHGKILD